MGQPIQQGGCHFLAYKHCRPLGEAEIGGNDDAGAFIEFADLVERQRTTRMTITKFKWLAACDTNSFII